MTEHQTRVETSHRKTTRDAGCIRITGNVTARAILYEWYMEQYVTAMNGGDRFHFTSATRRYLKALRELSQGKTNERD